MRAAGDCTRCIASREAGHSRKVARRGSAQTSPGSGSSPENARRRKMQGPLLQAA